MMDLLNPKFKHFKIDGVAFYTSELIDILINVGPWDKLSIALIYGGSTSLLPYW